MSFTLPINEMSFEEKVQSMEVIWDDLCHGEKVIDSPSWHGLVLAEREASIKNDEETFVDWDIAKKLINKATQ